MTTVKLNHNYRRENMKKKDANKYQTQVWLTFSLILVCIHLVTSMQLGSCRTVAPLEIPVVCNKFTAYFIWGNCSSTVRQPEFPIELQFCS